MDILYLVDRLENLVANSRRMPLLNQVIVKEADLLTIIETMRTSIPEEIKQARRTIQEKERILAQAQSDATAILAHAREESERILSREGLLDVADDRSQQIIRRASEQAQVAVRRAEERTDQMQKEADAYAVETLHNLREHLTSVTTEIERTILSIERGLESLEGPPAEEIEAETPEPQPPRAPRRASLAADTMGGPTYPT